MSEIHPLRVSSEDREKLEKVDPKFADQKLIWARDQSWKVLHDVRSQLKEGMTEDEARLLCMDTFKQYGVQLHWHRPYVRFGPGTMLTFHDELQLDHRLQAGDLLYFDLGPVWPDEESGLKYEGDVGDTFVFGETSNPDGDAILQAVRDLFEEGKKAWEEKGFTGMEIYQQLQESCQSKGFAFNDQVSGHRLSDFPHHKYTKAKVTTLDFIPSSTLWILELHIRDEKNQRGAFFEDLLVR